MDGNRWLNLRRPYIVGILFRVFIVGSGHVKSPLLLLHTRVHVLFSVGRLSVDAIASRWMNLSMNNSSHSMIKNCASSQITPMQCDALVLSLYTSMSYPRSVTSVSDAHITCQLTRDVDGQWMWTTTKCAKLSVVIGDSYPTVIRCWPQLYPSNQLTDPTSGCENDDGEVAGYHDE
jgi:hypothetical protein